MQKKRRKSQIVAYLLLLICIIAFFLGAYLIWKEFKKEQSIVELEKETIKGYTKEIPIDPSETETPTTESSVFQIDWNGLQSTNSDVIAWIQFENPSRINYPIVQTTNNQFYLSHDWRGYYQFAGSIFLNKRNNPNFIDANSVIYGHRMIGGSMFGSLHSYASQNFMDQNPYFYIYTPDGKKRTYECFAYSEVLDGSSVYESRFESINDRLAYFETVKNQAITQREIPLSEFDTTITLSTCTTYDYYRRMILEAKLIKIEKQ